jgi:hypothetical protein
MSELDQMPTAAEFTATLEKLTAARELAHEVLKFTWEMRARYTTSVDIALQIGAAQAACGPTDRALSALDDALYRLALYSQLPKENALGA